jgi:hypothetical protein
MATEQSPPKPSDYRQLRFPLPIDRVAIAVILVLILISGGLLLSGAHTQTRVRSFSWQGKQVGGEDTAFVLNFSRPMDESSVEQHLSIDPPLPGKISWAGRRLAYTLNHPIPYGRQFELKLPQAQERQAQGAPFTPFQAKFTSRDRQLVYIGTAPDNEGRLVLLNLSQPDPKVQILTPQNLEVMDFKPYPLGDRILFSAIERQPQSVGITEQQLYSVTTGVSISPPPSTGGETTTLPAATGPAGQIKPILDNKAYQNLRFDLSADGRNIVVQRVNRQNPSDFGAWLLRDGEAPKPLGGEPGGDFLITPDSESIAIAQGQGLAIVPLVPDAKPLGFLPKFGRILSFSRDGSMAAMVKFNSDQKRSKSLFLVTAQGSEKELAQVEGSILSAQFDPTKQWLYCQLTDRVIQGDLYQENPYIARINLKTGQLSKLLQLPNAREMQVRLAPDGLALLYDKVSADPGQSPNAGGGDRRTPKVRNLWIIPLDPDTPSPTIVEEPLPLLGLKPQWLP